jgi:hypothetical protein
VLADAVRAAERPLRLVLDRCGIMDDGVIALLDAFVDMRPPPTECMYLMSEVCRCRLWRCAAAADRTGAQAAAGRQPGRDGGHDTTGIPPGARVPGRRHAVRAALVSRGRRLSPRVCCRFPFESRPADIMHNHVMDEARRRGILLPSAVSLTSSCTALAQAQPPAAHAGRRRLLVQGSAVRMRHRTSVVFDSAAQGGWCGGGGQGAGAAAARAAHLAG